MCPRQPAVSFFDSQTPDNIKPMLETLHELYLLCKVLILFFFLSRLHPLRQQATLSRHTLTARTAWNKHKLTTPPNGSSCYQNSFNGCSKTQQCTHTPLLHHTFLQLSYSYVLDSILCSLFPFCVPVTVEPPLVSRDFTFPAGCIA